MPMETLLEYKCPACHGAIHFDATLQKMKCPYCDTELEVESLQELDAVLQEESVSDYTWQQEPAGQWSQAESENLRTYTCKFCGGEIIADEDGLTSIEGVYAGGDAVTGAATVILAMGAGKTAAASIDKYIQSK